MPKTLQQLQSQANAIINETEPWANDGPRVGGTIKDVAEYASNGNKNLIFQDPVPAFSNLATTYPNPLFGWASMVEDQGLIYQFNGVTWASTGLTAFPTNVATKTDLASKVSRADVVQTLGDSPSKIVSQRVVSSFFNSTSSANLFNHDTSVIGYYSTSDGVTLISNANYRTSDFIEVEKSTVYKGGDTRGITAGNVYYYDENYNYIGFKSSESDPIHPFTTPSNCKYVKVTFNITFLDIKNSMVVKGSVLPSAYIPFQTNTLKPDMLPMIPYGKMPKDINIVGSNVDNSPFFHFQNSVNLFNKDTVESGHYGVNGMAHVNSSSHVTSDYMAIEALTEYTKGSVFYLSPTYNYFYDEHKTLIGASSDATAHPIPISGSKFMRCVVNIANTPVATYMIVKGSVLPTVYVPFGSFIIDEKYLPKNTDISTVTFELMVALGDSIDRGFAPRNITLLIPSINAGQQIDSYVMLAARIVSKNFINQGIDGSTLARSSEGSTDRNPMCTRIQSLPNNLDLLLVKGGTNDLRVGIPIGTFTDTTEITYYGALHSICKQFITKFHTNQVLSGKPKAKLVFITPPKLLRDGVNSTLETRLEGYCNAIKEVAAYYSFPVLDMYNKCGINPHIDKVLQGTNEIAPYMYNKYICDGVHPTPEGHEIMRDVLVGFLKTLK